MLYFSIVVYYVNRMCGFVINGRYFCFMLYQRQDNGIITTSAYGTSASSLGIICAPFSIVEVWPYTYIYSDTIEETSQQDTFFPPKVLYCTP